MKRLVLLFIAVSIASTTAWADMGRITSHGARVSETAQKAVIFHNLDEEVLILGTELHGSPGSKVVRFIPFPSEPTAALAPGQPLQAAAALVEKYNLQFFYQTRNGGGRGEPVEIRFQKTLGAHEITILRADDAGAFGRFVQTFFEKRGLRTGEDYQAVEKVAADYIGRGFRYFVFDLVEVTEQTRQIEPIAYRFPVKKLYYPLITSNTFGGEGGIELMVMAPRSAGDPLASQYMGSLGQPRFRATSSALVTARDADTVWPEASKFFGRQSIYLQFFVYWGEYQFDADILFDIASATDGAVSGPKDSGNDLFEQLKKE